MTRYFFVILLMALIGVAIVVKAGITMFAERQYWQDVADRFVKENVTVKPNRGNIISSDGKLMASSLPEYRIYMDFMSGEKDEKRRQKGSGTPGFHPQCQYGFNLYRTSQDIPGQKCGSIQGTPQERTPGKKPQLSDLSETYLLYTI